MPDKNLFDDDWAELARELERDKPSTPPPLAENKVSSESDTGFEDALIEQAVDRIDASATDDFEDSLEGGSESENEGEPNEEAGSGEGQPGGGKKRRRRRRRRKKGGGGQPSEVGANEDSENEKADSDDGEAEESGLASEPGKGEMDYSDEPAEEIGAEMVESSSSDSEEDAGGDLLRELIANWNVPSWDDVVSGLYRPER
jgi:ribonuclease E